VNARKRLRADSVGRAALAACVLLAGVSGCATSTDQEAASAGSVQTLQYYPYQVKGYQNTYPKRTAAVIPAADSRDFTDTGGADHTPSDGHPAIGIVRNQQGKAVERLYGPALDSLVQNALAGAATEAGLTASVSALPLNQELTARKVDYVIAAQIKQLWVTKTRGPDQPEGPAWRSVADATLDVAVYKPPFAVAFWQGEITADYSDPPSSVSGANAGDEAEIYDQPGEVLSVALTRVVAGVFQREDLHTLLDQDTMQLH